MIDTVELRGVALHLHPAGEGVSDGIRRAGDFYEAEILDYLVEHHPVHDVIVDAGANIGNHTLFFATFLQHRAILAFEPFPENYALLFATVHGLLTVAPWAVALSDQAGSLRMRANEANMGACLVDEEGPVAVPALTLDSFELRGVTLLKLDVENHEAQVLAGARETIDRDHPLVLIEDWSFGEGANLLPGYELEKAWPERFTYLYHWRVD